MPKVGNKTFPYTAKGRAAAKKAKTTMRKKPMAKKPMAKRGKY
tara:strand:+ start:225 stop:353 length:129 start_codon:yes stop_codon:yes gene_type:complete